METPSRGPSRGQLTAAVAAEATARDAAVAAAIANLATVKTPKLKAGQRLNHAHLYGGTTANLTLAAGTLYATPFAVLAATTVSAIAINVVTAASAGMHARVGVATLDGDGSGWAGTLVDDVAELLVDSTGAKTAAYAKTFQPGTIYLALTDAEAVVTVHGVGVGRALFGMDTDTSGLPRNGLSASQAYGALPATKTFTAALSSVPLVSFLVS